MVDLKITLGTVNYTDYLHVTASKVSSPGSVAWETWIDVPVTNYNFVIPGLDPDNYYIRYYDALTNSALGILVAELIVNALTGDVMYERRFYTVDGPGANDPVNGATSITDPYLIGKNVTGVFKEAFRYLKPTEEYIFNDTTGFINLDPNVTNASLSSGEKVSVEIKYQVPSVVAAAGGLYNGTLTITTSTYALTGGDADKRIRLLCNGSVQQITLCSLASLAENKGFYFDNSCGGLAYQVLLILNGTDVLNYNGFNNDGYSSNDFTEFWVSKGEHLLIRKFTVGGVSKWEVITDYKGVNVGEKVTVGFSNHTNILLENGQVYSASEYPRIWWWINNILPATHKYNAGFFDPIDQSRRGQFAIIGTFGQFRMPDSTNHSERGLLRFDNGGFGTDVANRPVDYPGGLQAEMIGPHTHPTVPLRQQDTDRGGGSSLYSVDSSGNTGENAGTENRVKNIGVIYGRRI